MLDEYGIKEILIKHDAESALSEINEQMDKVCGSYMMDRDECRKAAFTEMKCHLLQAIIRTEDNDQLKQEIEKITKAI